MKFILGTSIAALLVSYAVAECNNMCSGHGICGANDMCLCYRNWRGADCSQQTCNFGVAFVDTPRGDLNHDGVVGDKTLAAVVTQWGTVPESMISFASEEGHGYMECSNKGLCDRSSGECVCFDGYEGSACQRTVCPNACNGNGICRNIVDLTNSLSASAKESYPLWDGLKNQACVCDPGFSGVDCSMRLCPVNADPLIDAKVYEVQTITVGVGACVLSYTDSFGETWKTGTITFAADAAANKIALQAGLDAVPNGSLEKASIACADTTHCAVTFAQAGNVNPLTIVTSTGCSAVAETTVGTNAFEECSFRGLCQYDTGLCKCFRGYRTDDCHLQHALAY